MTSLNPTMTIGKQIVEGIVKYGDKTKEEAKKIALDTLALRASPARRTASSSTPMSSPAVCASGP